MVKCVEVRDCTGFNLSLLLQMAQLIKLFKSMMNVVTVYPEVISGIMLFNLPPGAPWVWMIRHFFPQKIADKLILCDRGDWQQCVSPPRGMTPATLCQWCKHIDRFRCDPMQQISVSQPTVLRSLRISAGQAFSWSLRVEESDAKSTFKVRVIFFARKSQDEDTQMSDVFLEEAMVLGKRLENVRTGTSPSMRSSGIALLEIELRSKQPVSVLALLEHTAGPG